jgi:hypothetical protein
MHTKTQRLLLLAALVTASITATGCATHDRRDAAWDPRGGRALFEQLPNWDRAAVLKCGHHLSEPERRRRGLSDRC